jgi:hypothetical protein
VVKRILFLSLLSCSDVEKKVRIAYTVIPIGDFFWKVIGNNCKRRARKGLGLLLDNKG